MYKILLITPGQPALNPRIVKEADALTNAGYDVTVLYSYWNDWGDQLTKHLLQTKNWKSICIAGHSAENPITYFFSRIIYKIAQYLFFKLHLNSFAEFATSRSSGYLIHEAKKHSADLFIAHNLGALPAAVIAAKKHKAKCGFDAEDFHRYEVDDSPNSPAYQITKYIEDKYLKKTDQFTTSSPLISNEYQNLYPAIKAVTILNTFPKNTSIRRIFNDTGPIKLFWFSQTIGVNRGLNHIAKVLKLLNQDNFELHLLGYISDDFKSEFISNELLGLNNVYFHAPLLPDDIVNFASQFDIGIAAECNFPFNRDICLTNKIFTYLQAGLAIIASDTTAQKNFLDENRSIGSIYEKNNIQVLLNILSGYSLNRKMLFNACESSLNLGRNNLNWENESVKFLSLVHKTLAPIE
jgi:hypothetical protein